MSRFQSVEVIGAIIRALLGRISNPRLLVLLMATFAGAAAGGVAGKIAWGEIGGIGGQIVGGALGGIAWATWLFFGRECSADSAIKVTESNLNRARD